MWTPFCVSLDERRLFIDNILSEDNADIVVVTPDIEDSQYETVQLFDQNKVIAKRHRLFLRAGTRFNPNNEEDLARLPEHVLKDITDSFL